MWLYLNGETVQIYYVVSQKEGNKNGIFSHFSTIPNNV